MILILVNTFYTMIMRHSKLGLFNLMQTALWIMNKYWIRPFPALALISNISIRNTSFTCATSSSLLFLYTVLLLRAEVKRSAISTPKLLAILLSVCSVNCFCLPVSKREMFAASTPIASARSAIFMFFAWRSCLTRFPMFMRLLHFFIA